MKKRSLWVLVGLLLATLVMAFAACTKPTQPMHYELSETSISLTVGESKQLSVIPMPAVDVTWETGSDAVATVENGLVVAVGEGSTTVTATVKGEDPLTCTVTVTEGTVTPPSSEYALEVSSATLKTGETFTLKVLDKEGNEVTTGVTYTSDDEAVATVSEAGLVTAVAKGETTIKAQVGEVTLEFALTVEQAYAYSLDKTELDIAVGGTDRLTLIVTPDDGNQTSRPVVYTSSDPSVATVEGGTGKVTGVGKGTATITCSVDGEELTATVNVTEYTVKIGGKVLESEMTLYLDTEEDITVTADPAREVTATYASSDEEIVTVSESGHIVPNKMGRATITVTVAGVTFQTTVTVQSAYSINYTEYTLTLGGENTVQLEVLGGSVSATFESSDPSVATVSASGLVTAVGFGTTTVTTRVSADVYFETTITVTLGSALAHEDYTFGSGSVNLTYLDGNRTIDWRQYYGADVPERMAGNAGLIGNYVMLGCDDEGFWDYKAPVIVEDADAANPFRVHTYGRAVHGSYTVDVKVTNAVSKIVILTGAWKEAATISFSINGTVLQSESFVGGENPALARKYELTLDTAELSGEFTLTIEVNCPREHGGNVSLVAVAVIGKEAHANLTATTSSAVVTSDITGVEDITAAGSLDWLVASGVRKAGVPENSIINANGITYAPNSNNAGDWMASLTWTDGTAEAPANYRDFKWADNGATIPVLLYKGTSTVTVYATGWNAGYLVMVYDADGNFVNAYQGADEKNQASAASKIAITLNVPATGTYTFRVTTCRGAGNCGWAGIAVSGESAFAPAQQSYNLTLGGDTVDIALTGETGNLTFKSGDSAIVTVDGNGTMTAVAKGSTYITISDGTTERRVFVTVTEYTLESAASVSLPMGATSQIVISADPATDFTATYSTSNDAVATVSESGLITATGKGSATITVTVSGKTFTVEVNVVEYKLNMTEITLKAGKDLNETSKLEVKDEEGNDLPADVEVKFTSSNEKIATVDAEGVITAHGVGTATVTATVGTAEITCEITVVIPDAQNDLIVLDWSFENLSAVSAEYKTIDYKHWSSDGTTAMPNGANLIGDPNYAGGSDNFWDYKTTIGYVYSETSNRNVGTCYGKVSKGNFTIEVTISNKVSGIVFYTGAWRSNPTVTFRIGDREIVAQASSFGAAEDGVARKIVLTLDTSAMLDGETDTLVIAGTANEYDGGNVNVVALAVVGTEAQGTAASGSVEAQQLGDKGSNLVDLTEVGSYDWIYAHYEGDDTRVDGVLPTFRKFNGNGVFTGEAYFDQNGNAQTAGQEWDGRSGLKWTDGIRSDLVGTDGAEASVNPVDNDGNGYWNADATGGVDGYTNNYNTARGEIHITMHLAPGTYVVKAYLNSWRAAIATGIYDGNNNFVVGKLMINGDPGDGEGFGFEVTYTLTVTAESDFNLVIGKARSHGEDYRQVGWQAVAVAKV